LHRQASKVSFRVCRSGIVLLTLLALSSNLCLAEPNRTNQNNIAVASPVLQKMTPIADNTQPAASAKKPSHPAQAPVQNPASKESAKDPTKDEYPTLARMENITFGHANSGLNLETRLNYLEATIFRQSFSQLSPLQRASKLQETLFGQVEDTHFPGAISSTQQVAPPQQSPHKTHPYAHQGKQQPVEQPYQPAYQTEMNAATTESAAEQAQETEGHIAENQPFYQAAISVDELKIFVLQMINDRRQLQGLPTLSVDEVAAKVAQSHAEDMAHRNTISHFDAKGENPDQRYTKAGGSDALTECLTLVSEHGKVNRLLGMYFLRDLLKRQDDRDAIMSPDATGLGFAAAENRNRNRAFACFEIVSKHGLMQPVPEVVRAGDKIEVKGAVFDPYTLERITLAWENPNTEALASADETDEALPYFPPLDFVAYAGKSEKDWSTGIKVLQTAGFVACLAGGMFIPPVALAAPAFTMMGTGTPSEAKPVSDIPVKGGLKMSGPLFNVKIGISNDSKPGLYYLTVWALPAGASKSIPISRRIIVATNDHNSDNKKEKNDKQEKSHD
jgi:uncharacterized protein YkwD